MKRQLVILPLWLYKTHHGDLQLAEEFPEVSHFMAHAWLPARRSGLVIRFGKSSGLRLSLIWLLWEERCRLPSLGCRRNSERGFRHHRRRSDGITNQESSDDATVG